MARSLDRNNFSRGVPRPFGAANWVTLIRAVIALFLLALGISSFSQTIGAEWRWVAITGALLALCLDGVDGFLARKLRQASTFGARFDLETDALTMMALALLVWATNQAGPWVLLSGLMRYIFLIGGRLWRALAMPLPPRKCRQTLCVVQMVALILALIPSVRPFWAGLLCLFGLGLLGYSFAADTVWLVSRARMEGKAA